MSVATIHEPRSPWRDRLTRAVPFIVLAPSLAASFIYVFVFTGWTLYISLSNSTLLPTYGFVGFENFVSLFENRRWNVAYTNLFLFSAFYILGSMAVGLLLAILIDQRVRAESAWRTFFLYPLAVSFIVTGTVWSWLYNPASGIQALVQGWGWTDFSFALTTDRETAIWAVIITGIWQASGFAMALFLAGLRSIDPDIIKAAQIDGASTFRTYRRVILPTIAPIFIAVAVVQIQFAIKTFDLVTPEKIYDFCASKGFELPRPMAEQASKYLVAELGEDELRFLTSGDAARIVNGFRSHLEKGSHADVFRSHLDNLKGQIERQFDLCLTWIRSFVGNLGKGKEKTLARALLVQEEAAVMLMTEGLLNREVSSAATVVTVKELLGQHPTIKEGVLEIRLDEYLSRLETFRYVGVPAFRDYQKKRHELMQEERYRLRLDEYQPKVMSAFVRNKLINEVYLPLIGDNLAKQMGSAGADKRTDQMGMLLLISPPGYGKTTLMEYVASRLGLIFVKVNGPALGHSVTSLDPAEADNATSAQEVEKVNFGLEMGNNVMLYLDDIQHCDPEFLQKFISLCDGQRRIEGVWKGRTRTYDLKGKRFCIIMAGNPYTETGSKFQIPDMLANRADTYNLGDILSGKQQVFEMSYVENSLTSNPTLAPLASREQGDLYKFIQIAEGTPIPISEMKHGYSAAEADEIVTVLKKMMVIQKSVLMVNQMYIESASKDDKYRTEPPFKLQGSYRNMNKMAEKVVPVMNDKELEALINDHYVGESQTLTTGAEQNLLKLAELRGTLTESQAERWASIKKDFTRNKLVGGDDNDPVMKVTNVLAVLGERLEEIQGSIVKAAETSKVELVAPQAQENGASAPEFAKYLEGLQQAIKAIADRPVMVEAPNVTVQAEVAAPAAPATAPPAPAAPANPYTAPSPPPPSQAPPPAPAAPAHQAVEIVAPPAPPLNPAVEGELIPMLRRVAEMVRGPRSKTILLDGKLVDAFDALRDAEDVDDVMAALKPLKKRKRGS